MALIKNVPFIVRSMSDAQHSIYDNLDESSKKLLQSLMGKLIPNQNDDSVKREEQKEGSEIFENPGKSSGS